MVLAMFFTNLIMKKSKNKVVVKTNRGHTIVVTCKYAKKTPEWFWEEVYHALEYLRVFDGILKDG
jgi:hypothetical protein